MDLDVTLEELYSGNFVEVSTSKYKAEKCVISDARVMKFSTFLFNGILRNLNQVPGRFLQ